MVRKYYQIRDVAYFCEKCETWHKAKTKIHEKHAGHHRGDTPAYAQFKSVRKMITRWVRVD